MVTRDKLQQKDTNKQQKNKNQIKFKKYSKIHDYF